MTVSSTIPSASFVYTGPGDYEYTFLCYDEDHLQIYYTDTDGTESLLTMGTEADYTVALEDDFLGGTVTMILPEDTDGSLRIERVLPFVQEVDWVNNDPFDMQILERSFDQIVMLLQQMNVEVTAGTSAFEWEGSWATATAYSVRAMVEGPDGNWYYCNEDHTSGVFATDLSAGFWTLLINRASLVAAVADAELAEATAEAAALSAQVAQAAAEAAAENIVEAWEDSPTSYDYPDIVAGSNGYTYRCVGTSVVGEDPTTDDGTYWVNISSGSSLVATTIVNANATATRNYLHILAANCTLTLPATPSDADSLSVANFSGVTTCVVARNGSKINGLSEDLTIDVLNATMQFFYTGATYGWVTL